MLNSVVGTGNRAVAQRPNIPVCYETACKALAECLSIDEAKLWNDRAEALAAWAKIYHDNDATRKAKALRLHAFRRMGKISEDLAKGRESTSPTAPGARFILRNHGLNNNDADSCIRLARARAATFNQAVNAKRPPAPGSFAKKVRDTDLTDMAVTLKRAFVEAVPFCKGNSAKSVFSALSSHDLEKMNERLTVVYEWLDEFNLLASKRK